MAGLGQYGRPGTADTGFSVDASLLGNSNRAGVQEQADTVVQGIKVQIEGVQDSPEEINVEGQQQ